jgi:hypothetical protein
MIFDKVNNFKLMEYIDLKIKVLEGLILSIDKQIESIDWMSGGSKIENELTGEKLNIMEDIRYLKRLKKFLTRIIKLGVYKTFALQKNIGPPNINVNEYKMMNTNAKVSAWITYWCCNDLTKHYLLLLLNKEKDNIPIEVMPDVQKYL